MANVQRDLGWTEAELAASQKRVAPVWACFLPDVGADWGIENVASRREYGGRGIANAVVDHAVRQGSDRRCRLTQITTFIGKDAAQSVYKRSGFQFSDERRCSEMAAVLGAPGFVRFIRAL
jgi:ribosomal protein S18 acetylase RimI-like enzyme